MKNSLTRKGISVASVIALALVGLTATAPGNAAPGTFDDITDIKPTTSSTDNYLFEDYTDNDYSDDYLYIREGVKSGSISAQLVDTNEDDLGVEGVKVEAYFYSASLDAEDDTFRVAGDSEVINYDGGDIYAYGYTDADGMVTFNFTTTSAVDGDYVYVDFTYLDGGSWYGNGSVYIEWDAAYLDDFDVNDYDTSGSSATLVYSTYDQFGAGIDTEDAEDSDYDYQVTVVNCDRPASIQTKDVVNGTASFTVTNTAAKGDYDLFDGQLHYADAIVDTCDDSDAIYDAETEIYKNGSTSSVAAEDSILETDVVYGQFVNGNYDEDSSFAYWMDNLGGVWASNNSYAGLGAYVETEDGDDYAYNQEVVISGTGLYFYGYDKNGDEVFAKDRLVTETDDNGYVWADIYSHIENVSGQTVTITSGGKTETIKLKTYMSDYIDEEYYYDAEADEFIDAWVATWDWNKVTAAKGFVGAPAYDTSYEITITAKDVWGNPLSGAEFWVEANDDDDGETAQFLKIVSGIDDVDNDGYAYTNENGKAKFTVRTLSTQYPNRKELWSFYEVYLTEYDYDTVGSAWDFTTSDYDDYSDDLDRGEIVYDQGALSGWTGPQAQVVEAAAKGALRVGVFNTVDKKVRVFVNGKKVLTDRTKNFKFVKRITGLSAGDKNVTVWVGKKRMFSGEVTVN